VWTKHLESDFLGRKQGFSGNCQQIIFEVSAPNSKLAREEGVYRAEREKGGREERDSSRVIVN